MHTKIIGIIECYYTTVWLLKNKNTPDKHSSVFVPDFNLSYIYWNLH